MGATSLADIGDLRHDGNLELLLDHQLGSGPHCVANWTDIYAWTGANYTNVSDRFKDFYQKRLQWLETAIPALQPVRGANGYALSDKECLEAEVAAIQRFLRISPDAGVEQAARLANSKDRAEREFATGLLVNIGTPKARKYLEKLTKDPDSYIAAWAKRALSSFANRPAKIPVDQFTPV